MGARGRIVAASLLLAGCSLTWLDGLSGGIPPPSLDSGEASVDAEAVGDADGPSSPVVVAPGIGSARATGVAQSSHLLYAKNAGRWVLFYEDAAAPARLKTRQSTDFVTWSEGAALDLPYPHLGEGRNFAVTYLDTGHDVFHLSLSLIGVAQVRHHYGGRAVLQGTAVVFDALTDLGAILPNDAGSVSPERDPDGPAVVALANGKILNSSGWFESVQGGDFNVRLSTSSDTGGAWSPQFAAVTTVDSVPHVVNTRLMLPTFAGAFGLWEAGDVEPNPTGVRAARFDGTTWGPVVSVGFPSVKFDPNDWSAARLSDSSVHVVRWAGSYEHRIFDGSSWGPGGAIPDAPHEASAGAVLLAYGGALSLFAIESPTGSVRTTSWTGGVWAPWRELVKADLPRSQLTGFAGAGGVALTWVEARSGRLDMVAYRVP